MLKDLNSFRVLEYQVFLPIEPFPWSVTINTLAVITSAMEGSTFLMFKKRKS